MMEVKQNTPVDFNDLLTTNSSSNDADVVMEELNASKLKTELLKTTGASAKRLLSSVTNGTVDNFEVIDLDGDLDLDEPVNAELEEALLADEETMVVDKVTGDASAATTLDNGVEKKTEVSSAKKCADILRNTGDDLDTLLSKINDLAKIDTVAETHKDETCKTTGGEAVAVTETTAAFSLEMDNENAQSKAKTAEKDAPTGEAAESIADVKNSVKNSEAQNAAETATDTAKEVDKIKEKVAAKSSDQKVVAEISENKEIAKEMTNEVSKTKEILTVDLDDDEEGVAATAVTKEAEILKTENAQSDSKAVENSEDVEDSDDDVVFFIDKPKEKKAPAKEEKKQESQESASVDEPKEKDPKTNAPAAQADEDDDVVLLDDDDDEHDAVKRKDEAVKENTNTVEEVCEGKDEQAKPLEEKAEQKPAEKTDTLTTDKESAEEKAKDTNLDFDNSDNAVTAKDEALQTKVTLVKSKTADSEETNSNCSSSSNLLQEAKPAEEPAEEVENEDDEEAEADADGDDNDVELLDEIVAVGSVEPEQGSAKEDASEDGAEEEKETAAPPAKRQRLSEEEEEARTEPNKDVVESSEKGELVEQAQSAGAESSEATQTEEDEQKTVKRTHDALADTTEEKETLSTEGTAKKKLKTDETREKSEIKNEEEIKSEESVLMEQQDVKSFEPTTKIEEEVISVETNEEAPKTPIYELKVVPSDVPIPLYPPPILDDPANVPPLKLEFFKRFRKTFDKMTKTDLEDLVLQKIVEAIVHKSEFAEMREVIEKQEKIIATHRNKISELSKQFRDLEMVHNRVVKDIETKNSQFIMPVKITRAVGLQVYIPMRKTSEPGLNALANTTGLPSTISPPRGPTVHTSPQRPNVPEARATNSALASAAAAAAVNTRRGCVQKITPQRPVMNEPSSSSSGNTSTGVTQNPVLYRPGLGAAPTTSMAAQNTPRVLNKNALPGAMGMPRARISDPVALQQQQRQQQQLAAARQQSQANNLRKLAPKSVTPSTQPQYRRSVDAAPPGAAMDNYMSSLNTSISSSTAPSVSITPAKPKEKAVIDLTDEDDGVQAAAAARQQRLPVAPQSTVSANATIITQYATNNRNSVPPLTRMPSAAAGASNATNQINTNNKQVTGRQLANIQSQKLSSLPTTSGTSITRVHIASESTAPQRVKYTHPAPLPQTPPQIYNSAWKLPPPRPTIRISNLENGIVISWTMEESMERHAECVSYQIYAYQETPGPPMLDSWRHVGDVKAMLLPMAVTLTQFQEGQRYFFAVRAVDKHQRFGPFSAPKTWS